MPLDPRTPVLVASGQVNQRGDTDPVEPVELMAAAAREAAGARVLAAVESIRVVNVFSWRYRDPGRPLARLIGARDAATSYSGVGGNMPQSLVNQACLDIQHGRVDVVLIAGAETWRTRMRLRAQGTRPDWPRQDETVPLAPGASADVQRGRRRQPERVEPKGVVGRADLAAGPRQSDDQLALHQIAELQQHGGPGCRRDTGVGAGRQPLQDPFGALGFPVHRD
jgi:hypothetical protein